MSRRYTQNKMVTNAATVLLGCTILSTILLASLSGANVVNIFVTASLLAVVAVGIVVFKHKIWLSPELTLFILWITFSLISTASAYHVEAAFWKTVTLVQIALMVFATQQTLIWSKHSAIFMRVFALALVVSYMLSYSSSTAYELADMDIAGEHGSDDARIASTLADANMFGVTSCLALSLILMTCTRLKNKFELIGTGLLITLLIVGIFHSGSRTALIGLAVILFGAIFTFRLYRPSKLIGLGVVGFVIAAMAAVVLFFVSQLDTFKDKFESLFVDNDNVISRFEEFITVLSGGSAIDSADGSISGRTQMMLEGLNIVKEYPVVGAGLDNFRYVSGADTYAHSTPIEVLVSTGLVGAVIYYLIYTVLFYRLWKLSKQATVRTLFLSALYGLTAYMLMDITHVSFSEKTSWLFLAIVSATAETERRALLLKRKKSKSKRRKRSKDRELSKQQLQLAENN